MKNSDSNVIDLDMSLHSLLFRDVINDHMPDLTVINPSSDAPNSKPKPSGNVPVVDSFMA